jgi:hypothetical protein
MRRILFHTLVYCAMARASLCLGVAFLALVKPSLAVPSGKALEIYFVTT